MHLPDIRTGLVSFAILAVLAAFLASFASSDTTQAATYNPTGAYYLENCLPDTFPTSKLFTDGDIAGGGLPTGNDGVCVGGTHVKSAAAGSNPDSTSVLTILAPDSNFGSAVITLSDPAFETAADGDITNGDKVGGLFSLTTLGLINGACISGPTVDFIFYDSSTSGSLAVNPEGTADRWSSVAESGSGGGGPDGIVTDVDGDGLADSTSPFVGTNPSIYAPLFDPDLDYFGGPNGAKASITPSARYTGATQVPAVTGDWQLLTLFQFNGRDLQPFAEDVDNQPHLFGFVGTTDWDMSLTALNDLGATVTSPSTIVDFCTPLGVTTMLLGTTPGGSTRLTAPAAAGQYEFFQHSLSQRDSDLDSDGIENAFDTCPFISNIGDSRQVTGPLNGDQDIDGIDDACDIAATAGVLDVDGDGFNNRQDGCPQIADGGASQKNSELKTTYLIAASDGGPKSDGVTDACDANDFVAEGSFVRATIVMPVCITGGAHTDVANNDGICDNTAGSYSPDSDFDTWDDDLEGDIGTSPTDKCADTKTSNDEADDKWPPDFDDNKIVNIIDVLALKTPFNTLVPPTSVRFDLNADTVINIIDVLALKSPFNTKCADDATGAQPN